MRRWLLPPAAIVAAMTVATYVVQLTVNLQVLPLLTAMKAAVPMLLWGGVMGVGLALLWLLLELLSTLSS